MTKYTSTKEIEAHKVAISKKEKESLKETRTATNGHVAFRQAGEEVFGLVNVNGSPTRVEEGDYVVTVNGQVVAVKSKADFEAEYTEVKPAKKDDK